MLTWPVDAVLSCKIHGDLSCSNGSLKPLSNSVCSQTYHIGQAGRRVGGTTVSPLYLGHQNLILPVDIGAPGSASGLWTCFTTTPADLSMCSQVPDHERQVIAWSSSALRLSNPSSSLSARLAEGAAGTVRIPSLDVWNSIKNPLL